MVVGAGSGLDLDSKFAKQDWTQTQENQSPNTSGKHACGTGNTHSKFAIECVFPKKYFENE